MSDKIENEMHKSMQTIRYKLHTLAKYWETNVDTKQDQWLYIIDNHLYQINQVLDNALRSYDLDFSEEEYQNLERDYHKQLFSTVVSTNPIWLSMLMLLSNNQTVSDTNRYLDTQILTCNTDNNMDSQTADQLEEENNLQDNVNIIESMDFNNNYNELTSNSVHCDKYLNKYNDWSWQAEWELVVPVTMAEQQAIKNGKIKVD